MSREHLFIGVVVGILVGGAATYWFFPPPCPCTGPDHLWEQRTDTIADGTELRPGMQNVPLMKFSLKNPMCLNARILGIDFDIDSPSSSAAYMLKNFRVVYGEDTQIGFRDSIGGFFRFFFQNPYDLSEGMNTEFALTVDIATSSLDNSTTTLRVRLMGVHAVDANNASTTVWRTANSQELTYINLEPGAEFILLPDP